MRTFAAVGRHTGTIYGPFSTVAEASAYVRRWMQSNERDYEIVVWTDSHTKARRASARYSARGAAL